MWSRRLTGRDGGVNTTDAGTSNAGSAPGYEARIRRLLGHRDVAGVGHESRELSVRHGEPVNPEAGDLTRRAGASSGIVIIGTHEVVAGRHPHHAFAARPVHRRRSRHGTH